MKKKIHINGKPTFVEFDMLEKEAKTDEKGVTTTLCLFFINDKQYTGVRVTKKGKMYSFFRFNFIKFYNLKNMIEYIINSEK